MTTVTQIEEQLRAALEDPSSSQFLKSIIRTGLERDPVDVANELEWVSAMFNHRVDALLKEHSCKGTK